jgi:uncharacterized protein YjhX (UPF0386 family)
MQAHSKRGWRFVDCELFRFDMLKRRRAQKFSSKGFVAILMWSGSATQALVS